MKPSPRKGPLRIGLSANIYQPDAARMAYKGRRLLYMEEGMFHWVLGRQALAFLLPTAPPAGATVDELVQELDGVIMTGGVDMAPESYGEKPLKPEWSGDRHRDEYEIAVVRAALDHDKPLLGICRGHQVLNVALGGTLFQDIRTQNPGALHHRIFDVYEGNSHAVRFERGSGLAQLYGGGPGRINSVHHQAVKDVADRLSVEARSPDDGIVEAVRLKDQSGPYLVGVQWHPELQDATDGTLISPEPLLDEFLAAAARRRR
jgi:putative glutamine amidotransferase